MSQVSTSWYFLPIKVGRWGTTAIRRVTGDEVLPAGQQPVFVGDNRDHAWMFNDHTYGGGIMGLWSQINNASGRVLLGGLGLGLLALLLAEKPEVTEVVVVELNPDTIAAFRANGWDESKITIHCNSIKEYKDEERFDWILLDHVNQEGSLTLYHRYISQLPKIINNVGQPRIGVDVYTWEELFFYWCGEHNKALTRENYLEFAAPLQLPAYTQAQLDEYMENRFCEGHANQAVSNALRQVYENRKPKE